VKTRAEAQLESVVRVLEVGLSDIRGCNGLRTFALIPPRLAKVTEGSCFRC